MRHYKNLTKQEFVNGDYKIVPIRDIDKFEIMKWRNQQLYHLRQKKILTKKNQQNYFKNVVEKLFNKINPDQILFSYLQGKECFGYGGLVHINWNDKNAEISFIMETKLEKEHFEFHWINFLKMIEKVAFEGLELNKIYTHAFDLRPSLYPVLEKQNFFKEKTFIDINNNRVIIHSKLK